MADEENNAETWWEALRSTDPGDPTLRGLRSALLDEGTVEVPFNDSIARGFEDYLTGLPGWNDGPEHAPNPLLMIEDGEVAS